MQSGSKQELYRVKASYVLSPPFWKLTHGTRNGVNNILKALLCHDIRPNCYNTENVIIS